MKNLKKFFAFSIATAMVAGAVWAGTPAFRAVAESLKYWAYDTNAGKYVDVSERVDQTTIYTQAPYKLYKQNGSNYTEVTSPGDSGTDTHEPGTGTHEPGTGTHEDSSTSTPDISWISIQAKSHGLYIGETSKLSIAPYPSDAEVPEVTWKSSDSSVLEVKADGTIIGKKSGYATVTATAKDSRLSGLSDVVSIQVTKEGIELSPAEETIYVGGWAYINALIEHNSDKIEGDRITWSVDGSDKVYTYHSTDEDYWNDWLAVEGLKPGTAKITATIGSGKDAKSATSVITISSEASKQNATDPNAPTSEEQAKQEQTPESIANYQNWLATYGGGGAAAAPVGVTAVSGEVGQPGSEAIVNTGTGEPVAMFQSNDTTNTLLAAPVGVVPSGTKIETIEAGKDTPAFKAVQNKLSRISRRGTVQKVYGIAGLNPDGSLMTLINGKAAMSMPMPTDITVPAGKSLKVYLIDDNGQTTKLDTAIDQGRVVFEIPKFGTFAFVVE